MRADLEILARELKDLAENGTLPDLPEATFTDVLVWAEGWLLTLAELGIGPVGER
jgi:hypothetical protein